MENPNENEVIEDAQTLKEKGNQCIKEGKFKEAALLYTLAIKIEPDNYSLFSNRSLAYLRSKHYYLSLQDANETIRLQPLWAKGFFRRAEVESAVGLTEEAVLSYTRALQLQPHDSNIIDAIKRVTFVRKRKKEADEKLPWLCSCVGLIIGVFLVILDYVVVKHDNPLNPMMQVAFALAIAGGGLGLGKGFIMLENRNIERSLMPPDTEEQAAEKLPRTFRWIGLAVGTTVVLLDCSVTEILGLKNPVSQIAFALAVAVGGWGVGSFVQRNRMYKVNPPPDGTPEEIAPTEETPVPERMSNKYTKAQARYRYKKGKM